MEVEPFIRAVHRTLDLIERNTRKEAKSEPLRKWHLTLSTLGFISLFVSDLSQSRL